MSRIALSEEERKSRRQISREKWKIKYKNSMTPEKREKENKRRRELYHLNREYIIEKTLLRKHKNTNILNIWIKNIKETTSCKDCNNYYPAICMDFDHVTNNKKYSISQMVSAGLSKENIEEEIKKCEVVCSNCHRMRTYTRYENKKGMREFRDMLGLIKRKNNG